MATERLIVVLGMHRSGTSTIARALQTMGVSLGDKLMPAADGDNPKGFFEDTDIYALNVEMLHALQLARARRIVPPNPLIPRPHPPRRTRKLQAAHHHRRNALFAL